MQSEFKAALFDELEALFPDSDTGAGAAEYAVAGANGTTAGAHILLTGLTPGLPVTFSVEGPHTAFRLFELLPVPVEVNTGARQRSAYLHDDVNETVIRKAPFYVYEALKPMNNLLMPRGVSAAAAFKTPIEYARALAEDAWTITVTHAGQTCALTLRVKKYPVQVPRANKDTHRYVNWISYPNIARYHGLQMDTPEYFKMLENYLRVAVYSRQNVMPLTLSLFFSLKNGEVALDEQKLDRYIAAGRRAGIELFEGSAFCARAEGVGDNDAFYNSLDHEHINHSDEVAQAFRDQAFDKFDNGTRARVSLGGADPASPEGERVLRAQARLMYQYLEKNGMLGVWEQCCMDEPNDALAEIYRVISRIVHEEMPGIPVMEPVLPTHALTGSIDAWCPTNETYENDREYYDARVAAGNKLYVYTCLTPGGNYLNRMLDMQRVRQTYMGWAAARYPNVTGYLHWGFNQYLSGSDPFDRSCVMFSEQITEFHPKRAMFLPAGDFCLVYPGVNTVYTTTRSEAQRLGLEDLCLLMKLPEATRAEIVGRVLRGYADYEKDISAYRRAKEALLQASAEALG